jgi:predicted ATP-dependent protease
METMTKTLKELRNEHREKIAKERNINIEEKELIELSDREQDECFKSWLQEKKQKFENQREDASYFEYQLIKCKINFINKCLEELQTT